MGDKTKIEWTDATLNPIRARNLATGKVGWHCEHVSPGCVNCYAERQNRAGFAGGTRLAYKPGHRKDVEIFLDERMLLQPLRWKRPRSIFMCSMTDAFGEFVTDEMRDKMFAVATFAHWHTFIFITKRADRMNAYLSDAKVEGRVAYQFRHAAPIGMNISASKLTFEPHGRGFFFDGRWPLPNVALGVTAEDQERADERVPLLLATPAAIRVVSAEPLLGPISFIDYLTPVAIGRAGPAAFGLRSHGSGLTDIRLPLDAIIAGGESGPGARPADPRWFRDIRDQCEASGVKFHFKQWGEFAPGDAFGVIQDGPVTDRRSGDVNDWMRRYVVCEDRADRLRAHSFTEHATNLVYRVGTQRAGRLLDGRTHDDLPWRVQA